MSDLYDKQHDAEIVRLNDRITKLEASLADSNEALQVLGLKLAHAEGHSANTVGGPTPVMDAAPACEQMVYRCVKCAGWCSDAYCSECGRGHAKHVKELEARLAQKATGHQWDR